MRLPCRRIIFAALLLAITASGAVANDIAPKICANATRHAEETHHLPRHLLFAISLKETGRWDEERKESYTWPWTVTSGGAGRHYPSKFAAMTEVRRLLAAGRTNIDVGCMQINLRYHGKGFDSLEEAFDPEKNAEYAALFLTDLKKRHGNWREAIEHYHSSNEVRGREYRKAVSELQQRALKSAGLTMPDPSTDMQELAAAAAARADAVTADALARQERHARDAALRDARSAQQLEAASATARKLKAEFEARKARKLAAWQKRKAERQAAAEAQIQVN